MKKYLIPIFTVFVLLFSMQTFAAENRSPENTTQDLLVLEGSSTFATASTTTTYTKSFVMPRNRTMGLDFIFDSAAAVDVKIELEQGNVRPATENAADTTNYAVTDSVSAGITDEVAHIIELVPIAAKYGRLKLTGQGSNAASTKLTRLLLTATED